MGGRGKRSGALSALLAAGVVVFAGSLPALASPPETNSAANADMSGTEFASMSCLIGAGASGAAAILIGSVAIALTGGGATAAETAVAVPVLIATASAGCSIGGSVAPALTWMQRESSRIVSDIRLPRITPKSIPMPERSSEATPAAPGDAAAQAAAPADAASSATAPGVAATILPAVPSVTEQAATLPGGHAGSALETTPPVKPIIPAK